MLKRLTKLALANFGFELRRIQSAAQPPYRPGHDAFLDQYKLLEDLDLNVIFDIGAHHGQTTAKYHELFPQAHIFTFEPFPASFERVQSRFDGDPLVTPIRMAATDRDGDATFFSNHAEYTNSLLASDKAAAPWVPERTTESLDQIRVRTCALDSFCDQHAIERIGLLKTDVQGAELRLLHGARRLLSERRVDVLYLEVLFAPLYERQTDFCELLGFLGSTGYRLVGIYNINRGNNGLAGWGDGLFVREDFPMPDSFRERHAVA